jgi:hypothetical protein
MISFEQVFTIFTRNGSVMCREIKCLDKHTFRKRTRFIIIQKVFVIFSVSTFEWVSEWLLFNANSAIAQLYHGENTLIFNDDEVRFVLYQHA